MAVAAAMLAFVATPAAVGACPDDVPDNSEVDQYQESIPSACGDQGTDSIAEDGGGDVAADGEDAATAGSGLTLSAGVGLELGEMGADGRAVSDLVASAGGDTGGGDAGAGGAGRDPAGAAPEEGSASLISALVEGVGGSEGGLGSVGILLAVIAVLGIGTVAWRLVHR